MVFTDDGWLGMADAFHAAALGVGTWHDALSGLASASGSRLGELIGLGADCSVPFNWITEGGQQWNDDFMAVDGGNPKVNPFIFHGARARPLEVLASGDYLTPQARRRNGFINDFCRRWDLPYICQTPLIKAPGMLVGLAVMRSRSQGEIENDQRALFASMAPHVRAAVRTQMALEQQGPALVAGTLDALSLTAFICDRRGLVKAVTPKAEALLRTNVLRVGGGVLKTGDIAQSRALSDAIGIAATGLVKPGAPVSRSLLIRRAEGQPLVVDVIPLPRRPFSFGLEARALVLVAESRSDPGRLRGLLMQAYGLTDAEADVAMRLTEGQTPEGVAEARGAAVGTVRAQVRSIYAKLDVHRLNELMARVSALRRG